MNLESPDTTFHDLAARVTKIEFLLVAERVGREVELLDLLKTIWRRKWLIAAVTVTFAIASVALAFLLPVEYTATTLLAPADNSDTSKLSKLAQEFGGLAGLGGINMSKSTDQTDAVIKVLGSWGFLADFVGENHLAVDVFAATGWNRADNALYIDPDLYDVKHNKWVRRFDAAAGETAAPNGWELYKAFRHRLTVEQDKTTGLITIGVEFYSPILAKAWVDALVSSINGRFRLQDRQKAEESLKYLEQQLQQTHVEDVKTALYELIGEQMRTLMLTAVNREYVLKTISAARVPEDKSSPNRILICFGGIGLGLVLSLAFVIIRDTSSNTRHADTKR